MQSVVSAKRKNDAVITVSQHPDEHRLVIDQLNHAAERLTGYAQGDLVDSDLQRVLPDDINEFLESDLDFEDAGSDLASLFRRIRRFEILNRDGNQVPVSMKVFYTISEDATHPKFELLMRDVTLLEKIKELKAKVQHIGAGAQSHDDTSAVLNKQGLMADLGVVCEFLQGYALEVSFVAITVDNLDDIASKHQVPADKIVRYATSQVESCLREDDIVGHLDHMQFGALLFDCSASDAHNAMSRVKKSVESRPMHLDMQDIDVPISLSMGFMQISPGSNAQGVVQACLDSMNKARGAGGNRIYEVVG
tara:strand:+ start:432 stop:1352 length:921 start_codon:yes stop_codon:yes gene_type:complete